jgi:hypothetical protein
VSVAHPAPVMREYIAARLEAERAIAEAGLKATILGRGMCWVRGVDGRCCWRRSTV